MKAYIPEIDGLRALAVLVVIIYHINPLFLPGGFSGVDIFFVISGYVVSISLMNASDKKISTFLAVFYANRFIRILPSLFLCLALTILFSLLFIPQAWMTENIPATARSAFYGYSNFVLSRNGDSYYGVRSELNPFTQTWSLGVEEQFYLLYPIFFYIFYINLNRKDLFIKISLLIALFSVIYGAFFFGFHGVGDFYLLPGRLWELMVGGVLAVFHHHNQKRVIPRYVKKVLLPLALALLIYSLWWSLPSRYSIPQGVAPVLATLIFLEAVALGRESLAFEVFRLRFVRYIGKISYQLYLFHWPVFVILKWTIGFSSAFTIAVGVIITTSLACLSHYFLDLRIRFLKKKSPIIVVILFIVFAAIFGQLAQYFYSNQNHYFRGVAAINPQDWYAPPLPLANPNFSRFSDKTIYVLGDSHAGAYSTIFKNLQEVYGADIKLYQQGGCAFPPTIFKLNSACKDFLDKSVKEILSNAKTGDVVFLPGLRVNRLMNDEKAFEDADLLSGVISAEASKNILEGEYLIANYLSLMRERGIIVLYELPKPLMKVMPYRCFDWFNEMNPVCSAGFSVKRDFIEKYRQPIVEEINKIKRDYPNISTWDPIFLLCNDMECNGKLNNHPLYFDSDHLSAYGNLILLDNFKKVIQELVDDRWHGKAYPAIIPMNLQAFSGFGTTGLSYPEPWGRWTDGSEAQFIFRGGLPEKFELTIEFNPSSGRLDPGLDIFISSGSSNYIFKPPQNREKKTFIFQGGDLKENKIRIYGLSSSLPTGSIQNDSRNLGLAIVQITLTPIR